MTQAAVSRRLGKPILFHKVKGTAFPVLTSIYGTRELIAEIIGIDPKDFCRKWSSLSSAGAAPRPSAESAPPKFEYFDCKLSDLPLITYSERDGAPISPRRYSSPRSRKPASVIFPFTARCT